MSASHDALSFHLACPHGTDGRTASHSGQSKGATCLARPYTRFACSTVIRLPTRRERQPYGQTPALQRKQATARQATQRSADSTTTVSIPQCVSVTSPTAPLRGRFCFTPPLPRPSPERRPPHPAPRPAGTVPVTAGPPPRPPATPPARRR